MTSHCGLTQIIINEPIHILGDSSSCVDLAFPSQQNLLVLDSGVNFSWHSTSHHQILFAKFDLKVFYSPPYKWCVWH